MEVCRVGEAMLRAHAQPLLTHTPRRTAHRAGASTFKHPRCRVQHQTRRAFTSSPQRRDDQAQPPPNNEQHRSTAAADISSLLDHALDFDKGTPAAPASRTSRFKSPSMQATNPPPRATAMGGGGGGGAGEPYRPRAGNSVEDLISAMGGGFGGPPPPRRAGTSPSSSSSAFPDIDRMLDPRRSPTNNNNTRALRNPPPSIQSLAPPEKSLGIKLNASVGRRVETTGTVDPARAFRTLEAQCARNSVRKDFGRQRFHERPGLKRKRLKGERWRRRFREGFRGVVQLVQKMRRQGW
ncbi:hypothetical protein LTR36_010067 [Oleoguttula mirabilis]|uniref:Ribosomal protein S21 n=1 Tax=Oleoguttula mirabilis TaxID=1507867 RepID=A0AAV9JRU8_9PEZI|nr:hypothetical protein LTR36_010067 [Oleoguttula mirabilis]